MSKYITITFEVDNDFTKMTNINYSPANLKAETIKGILQAGAEAIELELEKYGDGIDLCNQAQSILECNSKNP
jgi:hypothetical protein